MMKNPFPVIIVVILLVLLLTWDKIKAAILKKKNETGESPATTPTPDNPTLGNKVISSKTQEQINAILGTEYVIKINRFLIAQFLHETGYGQSRVFNEQNNPWGMRCVVKRPTTQVGCANNYGVYRAQVKSLLREGGSAAKMAALDMNMYLKYYIDLLGSSSTSTRTGQTRSTNVENYIDRMNNYTLLEYVTWLKNNSYFEDSIENYYNGCLAALRYYDNNKLRVA